MAFDYSLEFKEVNFRKNPELNRGGRGEQGVMLVEPYKEEILPHWRFKTPDRCDGMFLDYKEKGDQMGFTRGRRYTNYKGGKKSNEDGSMRTAG